MAARVGEPTVKTASIDFKHARSDPRCDLAVPRIEGRGKPSASQFGVAADMAEVAIVEVVLTAIDLDHELMLHADEVDDESSSRGDWRRKWKPREAPGTKMNPELGPPGESSTCANDALLGLPQVTRRARSLAASQYVVFPLSFTGSVGLATDSAPVQPSTRVGFFGTGLIARYIHTFLAGTGWSFDEIGVYDLSADSAAGFPGYLERSGTPAGSPCTTTPSS